MLNKQHLKLPQGIRLKINQAYHADEKTFVEKLCEAAEISAEEVKATQTIAEKLVKEIRIVRKKSGGIDSFLTEYALSSHEGIALMCLAEALLRVPDKATIDSLIKDKLSGADWKSHQGKSPSFFVNATTWALMLTGKVLSPEKAESVLSHSLMKFVNRTSEGFVRKAVNQAMRIMSKQFVMGRNIKEAIERAKKKESEGYRYSYDMLGEAAVTARDAERYFKSYSESIESIGQIASGHGHSINDKPGISVKLSALHPRYYEEQKEKVENELTPKLLKLAQLAKKHQIALTVDAEESERLDLSLDIMEAVFSSNSLEGWEGFGLAVQSYQKRAFYVLDWVAELAKQHGRRINVRLIKGAYWDSEIKKSQVLGLKEYPVFTRKVFTDVSFQACAKKLFGLTDVIYPQFATHNGYSVALILEMAGEFRDFEFQCLHGMGTELYDQIVPKDRENIPCRIYAPVGVHEDLLPYLVRRLLENGANSSFVNRIVDDRAPVNALIEDPVAKAKNLLNKINKNIPLPENIYGEGRLNSKGFDLTDREAVAKLQQYYEKSTLKNWRAYPVIAGETTKSRKADAVFSPQQKGVQIGEVAQAEEKDIDLALNQAQKAFLSWSNKSVEERARLIEAYANLLEKNMADLLAIACLEAGKTWSDGIAEVREAVDFCRYYAQQARKLMGEPMKLDGYTGESDYLSLHPRGIVVCISPWNFPLAIFTGQIAAALVTGNTVIAKPAEQTPLIAYRAAALMLEAGIPEGVIQLLPGSGEVIGAGLTKDKRVKGVIFTGSTQTAALINQTLANRGGEIIPLIAETGGQNAMIVDSSALLEQVTKDVVISAFGSAGQRCSALRVLYLQDEIYEPFVEMLQGAMKELQVGLPQWLATDVGPVIDGEALRMLQNHVSAMEKKHKIIAQTHLSEACESGTFMPPTAIEINHISDLSQENFGPICHVIRFKRSKLDDVIDQINNTGFGLTFGIHSRINEMVAYVCERIHAGNRYVNRNMTGAVVGLQPFGGEGLSGTGPKAGGPHYLLRLCHERALTIDTTAAGGNASLMSLSDDDEAE